MATVELVADTVAVAGYLLLAYQLVQRWWRWRLLRRAGLRLIAGPASVHPPTSLVTRGRFLEEHGEPRG